MLDLAQVGLPIRSVITSKNTIGLVWHDHLLLKLHYIFITFSAYYLV